MSKDSRVALIKQIQEIRKSLVITYVTSTRANAEVQMAMDSIRKIFDHVIAFNKSDMDIDLFLYSNGGDGTVPWRLVTLIREYAKKFSVLIPFRAFSAATLTALGADEVIMHPMGMLGPTDPTVMNDFNPPNPANPQTKLGISVEDVSAYINLIKEDAGITHDDELIQAFNKLPEQVHPLALGNVKRSLAQSRMMARKLLSLHMDTAKDQHQIQEIVDNLTSKLYYHGHPINRDEASKQIGIKTIKKSPKELDDLIWKLYLEYESEMKLDSPFNPLFEFLEHFENNPVPPAVPQPAPNIQPNFPIQSPQGMNTNPANAFPMSNQKTPKSIAKLVYIESENKTDVNLFEYEIIGGKAPNGVISTQLLTLFQGWRTE